MQRPMATVIGFLADGADVKSTPMMTKPSAVGSPARSWVGGVLKTRRPGKFGIQGPGNRIVDQGVDGRLEAASARGKFVAIGIVTVSDATSQNRRNVIRPCRDS